MPRVLLQESKGTFACGSSAQPAVCAELYTDTSEQPKPGERARLLFLTHAFPPRSSSGGIRALEIAKALACKEWIVTVATPHISVWEGAQTSEVFYDELSQQGIRCIRTPHRWPWLLDPSIRAREKFVWRTMGGIARRIASVLRIEPEVGWIADAEKACAGLVPEDVDLVLASGPPFVCFELASRIAARLGRPCVLDYSQVPRRTPEGTRASDEDRPILTGSAEEIRVFRDRARSVRRRGGMTQAPFVLEDGIDLKPVDPLQEPKMMDRLDAALRTVLNQTRVTPRLAAAD